jgi:ribokinase
VARVAVVGSYGVGLRFESERLPGAGETVVGQKFRTDHAGTGSNQAVGAARLGAEVCLLTAVGTDAFGDEAFRLWEHERVDASAVVRLPTRTMAGAILVDARGEKRIVAVPGALAALEPAHVDAFAARIATAHVLLVQLEIPVAVAHRALAVAREHGVCSILNPAPLPESPLPEGMLELANYLTPNETEAAALGVEISVVTRGADGADLRGERIPAFPAKPVDSTGAADAFNAALAVALGEGRPDGEAVRWGCAAGAHMVEHRGVIPGLPTRAQLEKRLASVPA